MNRLSSIGTFLRTSIFPAAGAAVLLVCATQPVAAQVINEIQASNSQTIADDDGNFSDWIELFNPNATAVQLEGFGVSDNPEIPFKWVLPSVVMEPGSFLLIWASGKDRTDPAGPLHTNFRIAADGEPLVLTRPDGSPADFIEPRPIPADVSVGRKPGSDGWFYFDEPTPGLPNTTTAYEGWLPAPVLSRESGIYTDPFILTISATQGASIRYTANGVYPTTTNAALYISPLSITSTMMLQVFAVKEGWLPSPKVSAFYTRVTPEVALFESQLPLVILHDYTTPITSGEKTPASIVVIDTDDDGTARINSGAGNVLHSRVLADIRGSSSQSFDKKMFGFHLTDMQFENREEALLGLPADHNWILYAPYSDKTMMRNVLAYSLAAGFGRYAPRTRFVELYKHSGTGAVTSADYHGVYVLVERIRRSADRVNISRLDPDDNAEPDISGGYIIKKDRLGPGETGFRTTRGTDLAFDYPSESALTAQQKTWIRNYMNMLESALYSDTFTDPVSGYRAYIDTGSFIDHFLLTEYLKEIDGYRLSTFMTKNRNQKLVMGPVWDFNLSAGNANYLQGELHTGWYYTQLAPTNHCVIGCNIRDWYVRLLQDPAYVAQMQERWWELRRGLFSEENITALIEGMNTTMGEAVGRNFERWPILGTYVWPNPVWFDTHQKEVDWMHNWLLNRLEWMDAQMGTPPVVTETQLAHYFYFGTEIPNDQPLARVDAVYAAEPGAFIRFESAYAGYPFTPADPEWRKASMERRNSPTALNYRPEGRNGEPYDEGAMRGLQVRQPFLTDEGENALIIHLPSNETGSLLFSFAAKDEGAAERIQVSYSVTEHEPEWKNEQISPSVLTLSTDYQLFQIDFSDVTEANYNPNFKIRLRFEGDSLRADSGNRVTFNNMTLDYAVSNTSVERTETGLPAGLELSQNYPNPFNPSTRIRFAIGPDTRYLNDGGSGYPVRLAVYDLLGREVAVLVDEPRPPGIYTETFDAGRLASGLYLYRLSVGGETRSRKMTVIK